MKNGTPHKLDNGIEVNYNAVAAQSIAWKDLFTK